MATIFLQNIDKIWATRKETKFSSNFNTKTSLRGKLTTLEISGVSKDKDSTPQSLALPKLVITYLEILIRPQHRVYRIIIIKDHFRWEKICSKHNYKNANQFQTTFTPSHVRIRQKITQSSELGRMMLR